jgi:hypothetical protein
MNTQRKPFLTHFAEPMSIDVGKRDGSYDLERERWLMPQGLEATTTTLDTSAQEYADESETDT